MIISASRRTDICAFHSDWFMNRIGAGYAMVRNPVYRKKVSKVFLTPKDVDLLVFVTKNPGPMARHTEELSEAGYEMSFQVTINSYGDDMEPNVPDVRKAIDSFIAISETIGPDRMMWRYDPVIFSDRYNLDFHIENFTQLAHELSGHSSRCTFSFLDLHDKHSELVGSGVLRRVADEEKSTFVSSIVPISRRYGFRLSNCCADRDWEGVERESCLDAASLRRWNIPFEMPSSPVRKGCGCVKVVDIGEYDTCNHDCIYCYANRASSTRRGARIYNPDSEFLAGGLEDDDLVSEVRERNCRLFIDNH